MPRLTATPQSEKSDRQIAAEATIARVMQWNQEASSHRLAMPTLEPFVRLDVTTSGGVLVQVHNARAGDHYPLKARGLYRTLEYWQLRTDSFEDGLDLLEQLSEEFDLQTGGGQERPDVGTPHLSDEDDWVDGTGDRHDALMGR